MTAHTSARKTRVCVVGAGVSGLSAALTLQDRGYEVTVLEKSNSVGGKVKAVKYLNKKCQIGQHIVLPSAVLKRLEKRFNIHKRELPPLKRHYVQSSTNNEIHNFRHSHTFSKTESFSQLLKFYMLEKVKLGRLNQPEFGEFETDSQLNVPFDVWLTTHKLPYIKDALLTTMTGFGFGYIEQEVPAITMLKCAHQIMRLPFTRLLSGVMHTYVEGCDELWGRISDEINVILDTHITAVERTDTHVKVYTETSAEPMVFDHIIIASPLDESLQFLDASSEEQELFTSVHQHGFSTWIYEAKGLTSTFNLHEPHVSSTASKGHVVCYQQAVPDLPNVFMMWVYTDLDDESLKKTEQNIREDIKEMGGTPIRLIYKALYNNYNPHFSAEAIKQGALKRMAQMQGKNRTCYIGELPTGAIGVVPVVEHAVYIAEKCFPLSKSTTFVSATNAFKMDAFHSISFTRVHSTCIINTVTEPSTSSISLTGLPAATTQRTSERPSSSAYQQTIKPSSPTHKQTSGPPSPAHQQTTPTIAVAVNEEESYIKEKENKMFLEVVHASEHMIESSFQYVKRLISDEDITALLDNRKNSIGCSTVRVFLYSCLMVHGFLDDLMKFCKIGWCIELAQISCNALESLQNTSDDVPLIILIEEAIQIILTQVGMSSSVDEWMLFFKLDHLCLSLKQFYSFSGIFEEMFSMSRFKQLVKIHSYYSFVLPVTLALKIFNHNTPSHSKLEEICFLLEFLQQIQKDFNDFYKENNTGRFKATYNWLTCKAVQLASTQQKASLTQHTTKNRMEELYKELDLQSKYSTEQMEVFMDICSKTAKLEPTVHGICCMLLSQVVKLS